MQAMRLTRKARWAVPAGAVIVAGGVIAGSAITVAQASPDLPVKTPAQLLADIASTHAIPPLTGTVVETTSLGLPALPQVGNPTSLASLLTGSHTVKVYYQDDKHFRLAVPQTMTETDIIRTNATVWLWESAGNSVTKFTIPADVPASAKAKANAAIKAHKRLAPQLPDGTPLTPQQAANEALNAAGKTTVVSVQSTLTVAGQAAYQLVLAPKDARSTIGSVRIAIDGKTGVPLRVQVFAKGSATPAFQVGYTDIAYVAPDPANLAFSPPPGATVTNGDKQPASASGSAPRVTGQAGTYGQDWLTVAELPQSLLSGARAPQLGGPGATTPAGTGAFGKDSQAAIGALLGAAKPVSGAWGSGTLLHTSLVNILFVGNEMYLGAVDPSVLYAAVGHTTPVGAGS
jgi:outer membrane lipoprotein-sorting protein